MIAKGFDRLVRRGFALLASTLLLVGCGTEAGSGAVGFSTDTAIANDAADGSAPGSEDGTGGAADAASIDTSATDVAAADATGPADAAEPADTADAADTAEPADTADTADVAATTDASGADIAGDTASPSEGACDNPADIGALAAADPNKAIGGCVTKCFTPGPTCSGCLQTALGVSDGCTVCFASIVDCTVKNCALQCIVPGSPSCSSCQQQKCFPAFVTCAGVSPP